MGELVLTRHHESGEIGWYPVTGLIETPQSALLVLTLLHEGGNLQVVETTDEHPYRVGESWTRADELSVGSVVRTFDGEAVVESIQLGGRRQPVYNITVGGAHSYLIGYEMVWVHNCGFESLFKIKFEHFAHRKGWDKILGKSDPTNEEIGKVIEEVVSSKMGLLGNNGVVTITDIHNGFPVYVQIYTGRGDGLYEITSAGLR